MPTVTFSLFAGAGTQLFDNNGDPLSGGLIYTYAAGTTTPATTYTSSSGSTPNSNPIVLDSSGRVSNEIWLVYNLNYKFVVKNSDEVIIGTYDNIGGAVNYSVLTTILSGSDGSSYIGFIQDGTGAVTRTSQSKMRDIISFLDFGGATTNTAPQNNTAMTNALTYVASVGGELYIPKGTYLFSTNFTTTDKSVSIVGDGDSTILDFSSLSSGQAFTFTNSLTSIQGLGSAVSEGATSLTFTSSPSVLSNDVIILYNPTDYSFSAARSYYRAGEFCKIANVSGASATLITPLYAAYAISPLNVYKLNTTSISIRNLKIIGGPTSSGLIKISCYNNPIVENVSLINKNIQCLEFDRCYDVNLKFPNIFNTGAGGGQDYGVVFSNCQNARSFGGQSYARRHAFALGGSDNPGAVPYRNIRIIGATISNDASTTLYSADFHGNGEDSYYEDCDIYNGGTWGGKSTGYRNCRITSSSIGAIIYASEVVSGNFILHNCNLWVYSDPSSVSRGIVDIGGNSNALSTWTTGPCLFSIKNCTINGTNMGGSTDFVKMVNYNTSAYLNVEIDGLITNITGILSVLKTNKSSGTANSNFIIIDNLAGFQNGTNLHAATGNHYLNFPHRLQAQTGSTTLSAPSGSIYVLDTVINFKYVYPRQPCGNVSNGQTNGLLYNGNDLVLPNIYKLTNTSIQLYIAAPMGVPWTSTSSVNNNWRVGINEV